MPCCCINVLNLCKASVCQTDTIVTGILAASDGEYQLVLDYLGNQIIIRKSFLTGEALNFSASNLNEKYTYKGQILNPFGAVVSITVDEVEYDCISFETVMTYETEIVNP